MNKHIDDSKRHHLASQSSPRSLLEAYGDPSFIFPIGCEDKVKKRERRGIKVKERENPQSNHQGLLIYNSGMGWVGGRSKREGI